MVQLVPLGDRVERGRTLIRELTERGVNVLSALWVFDSEDGDWSLRLSTADRDLRDFAGEIWEIVRERGEAVPRFGELMLVVPNDAIHAENEDGTPSSIVFEQQLGGFTLDRQFYDDAYIYRTAA